MSVARGIVRRAPWSAGADVHPGVTLTVGVLWQMDMIVMGHRGQGAAGSALAGTGSVTDHCMHNATCPVIATRFKQADN